MKYLLVNRIGDDDLSLIRWSRLKVISMSVCGRFGIRLCLFLLLKLVLVLVSKVSVKIAANCDTGAAEKKYFARIDLLVHGGSFVVVVVGGQKVSWGTT